jgi:hypothetical protein
MFLNPYRRADNSRPVSVTVSAWEWVYATNLSRLQRERNKRHVGEAHSVIITAIPLPRRLSCYCGKIVSVRMLTNLRLARLASDHCATENHRPKSAVRLIILRSLSCSIQTYFTRYVGIISFPLKRFERIPASVKHAFMSPYFVCHAWIQSC